MSFIVHILLLRLFLLELYLLELFLFVRLRMLEDKERCCEELPKDSALGKVYHHLDHPLTAEAPRASTES